VEIQHIQTTTHPKQGKLGVLTKESVIKGWAELKKTQQEGAVSCA
jgi:hypothetical protein